MIPLALPDRPRRAELWAFSGFLGLAAGASLAAAAGLAGLARPWLIGGAAAVLLSAPGLLRPGLARRLYRRWNRLATGYGAVARSAVCRICFLTAVVAAGRPRGAADRVDPFRLRRPRPGESLWTPRGTLPRHGYTSEHGSTAGGGESGGLRGLWTWGLRSGRAWVVPLVPFLALLRALGTEEQGEDDPPSDTYTLY